jgi:predicted RNase H-like HicB family nuclease
VPYEVTYGETIEEARRMARDALEGLIEVMIEHGEPIPKAIEFPRKHRDERAEQGNR